jgi:hypothetical protein
MLTAGLSYQIGSLLVAVRVVLQLTGCRVFPLLKKWASIAHLSGWPRPKLSKIAAFVGGCVGSRKKWGWLLFAALLCWFGLVGYARVSLDYCLLVEPFYLWSACEPAALLWLLLSRPLAVFVVVAGLALLWCRWLGRRFSSKSSKPI